MIRDVHPGSRNTGKNTTNFIKLANNYNNKSLGYFNQETRTQTNGPLKAIFESRGKRQNKRFLKVNIKCLTRSNLAGKVQIRIRK
jgi:hypothetical protein